MKKNFFIPWMKLISFGREKSLDPWKESWIKENRTSHARIGTKKKAQITSLGLTSHSFPL